MSERLNVAYILHRFPSLRETYIVREMYWVREHGVDLTIHSLLPPRSAPVHQQAEELLPHVRYGPLLSAEVLRSELHYLRRKPIAYLRALGRVIGQTWREPLVLVKALALFPRSVHLARQLEQAGTQHVHAHFCWLEGITAGTIRELTGIPFTTCPHAFDLYQRHPGNVRAQLENASHIVTISDYNRRFIRGLSPRLAAAEIDVVHCGVDLERYTPDPRDAAARDGWAVRILSVGSLVEKKGYAYLVEACALLKEQGIHVACDIVGGGPLEETLRRQIAARGVADRVRLLGAMRQEDVAALLGAADIFALPCVVARDGDRDGIPVAAMEAMATGLPVVSTNLSGIPELVRDGETGLLAPPEDAAAFAAALRRLVEDTALRARLGEAGRQLVAQEFQAQHSAARLAVIFRRVAGAAGTGDVAPAPQASPEGRRVEEREGD